MDKEKLIERIEGMIEDIDDTLERLNDGDMDFSDVGDYYHSSHGGDISSILEDVLSLIRSSK